MRDVAEAIEALKSYDLSVTKEALDWLVDQGEVTALEHVLPLTLHPDVALRHFAKRTAKALRELLPAGDVRSPAPGGGAALSPARDFSEDVAPRGASAAKRLPFFKLEVII